MLDNAPHRQVPSARPAGTGRNAAARKRQAPSPLPKTARQLEFLDSARPTGRCLVPGG
jgi:hypothetical protein